MITSEPLVEVAVRHFREGARVGTKLHGTSFRFVPRSIMWVGRGCHGSRWTPKNGRAWQPLSTRRGEVCFIFRLTWPTTS